MRWSRQSGHGGSLRTYWKKYAPRMVAAPPTATSAAAATGGCERIKACIPISLPQLAAPAAAAAASAVPAAAVRIAASAGAVDCALMAAIARALGPRDQRQHAPACQPPRRVIAFTRFRWLE